MKNLPKRMRGASAQLLKSISIFKLDYGVKDVDKDGQTDAYIIIGIKVTVSPSYWAGVICRFFQ